MKGNADKCHLLVSSNEKVTVKIGSHEIVNSKREKLLGVYLDSGLSYDYRISKICKKESREVNEFWMRFSSHSLTIVRLLGCAIFERKTIKSTDFMKGV